MFGEKKEENLKLLEKFKNGNWECKKVFREFLKYGGGGGGGGERV